jgi:tRNA threonylcarbamoyladenosine biosynthesis protein TsaE
MLSKNTKETKKIAKIFLAKILKKKKERRNALVVGLSGELGAGKTTFVQVVAQYLGVKNKVKSPTFVIVKKYPIKNKEYKFLFHLDAYRLNNEKELLHLGWEEIIDNKEHLVFIEWPEKIAKIMPRHIMVKFEHVSENQRKINIA